MFAQKNSHLSPTRKSASHLLHPLQHELSRASLSSTMSGGDLSVPSPSPSPSSNRRSSFLNSSLKAFASQDPDASAAELASPDLMKIPDILPSEAAMWYNAICRDWRKLGDAPQKIRGHKEMVILAIHQDGRAMKYATEEARANKALILEAVAVDGRALEFASMELKQDRDVLRKAFSNDGIALKHVASRFREDPELATLAVQSNWRALSYIGGKMRFDHDLAMDAVRQSWQALRLLTPECRRSKEVILEGLKQDAEAMRWADGSLHGDRELQALAQQSGWKVQQEGRIKWKKEPLPPFPLPREVTRAKEWPELILEGELRV
mmetsp:Transcript_64561/g.154239  ORF Transcript_64561/g.154239 Transcript_64561/m.154239 type:complete len:322 (+) Transcript_64561:90-1055(+)